MARSAKSRKRKPSPQRSKLPRYVVTLHVRIPAFFKVVVAFCNKITLCSLFFWIQVDF
ncbi:hypothetical protein C3986_03315 [Escherichia coli]|nr:hypothetical protein C3986_03315 [Escherichia coli]